MDFINKAPRWFILFIFSCVCTVAGIALTFIGNTAYADMKNTKSVAYQAKNTSETAQMQVAELRGALQDIKNDNEKHWDQYRQDQARLDDKLTLLLKR